MLRDRHEYPCWTIDVSPGGVAVLGLEKGAIGEPVIAYIDKLGRIEGQVARNFDRCFAIALQLPPAKRERLAQTLAWLVSHRTGGAPDNRERERVRLYGRRTTLTLPDGAKYRAAVIDLSVAGAALDVGAAPAIGTRVLVGRTSGRVARLLPTGIAVEFDTQLSVDDLHEGGTL
jgi:hypothetical protein